MKKILATTGVVLLLAVAGCTSGNDVDSTAGRLPGAAATTAPAAAPAPADDSCKPRQSYRPTGSLPAPGDATIAKIKKRGRLVLGTSQDTLLFSSRNPFTGAIEGFDVDMGRQIARAIFGDPNKLQIKVIGYDQRVPDAKDGTVDIVADTMTINCDRWKDVDFSAVYYDAGQRVLVSTDSPAKGIADLSGKRVCAAVGSTSLDNIRTANPKAIPIGKPAFADCLVAFQQNQVDAISTDDVILAGLAAQDPYAKVVGPRFTEEPYGIAVAKTGDKDFVEFVNQVLARNKADGTWKATYTKWLSKQFGPAPQPPAAEYK